MIYTCFTGELGRGSIPPQRPLGPDEYVEFLRLEDLHDAEMVERCPKQVGAASAFI